MLLGRSPGFPSQRRPSQTRGLKPGAAVGRALTRRLRPGPEAVVGAGGISAGTAGRNPPRPGAAEDSVPNSRGPQLLLRAPTQPEAPEPKSPLRPGFRVYLLAGFCIATWLQRTSPAWPPCVGPGMILFIESSSVFVHYIFEPPRRPKVHASGFHFRRCLSPCAVARPQKKGSAASSRARGFEWNGAPPEH